MCQVTLIHSGVYKFCPSLPQFSLQYMQSCFNLPTMFVCSAPKGFPCWKEQCDTDVYCNHIPLQKHAAFCSQCSSVADLLDLISNQNCTNVSSTVLHTLTPVRPALPSDRKNVSGKHILWKETCSWKDYIICVLLFKLRIRRWSVSYLDDTTSVFHLMCYVIFGDIPYRVNCTRVAWVQQMLKYKKKKKCKKNLNNVPQRRLDSYPVCETGLFG